MVNLALFMAENKKKTENVFYPATKSICDENGKPVEWEFKPISSEVFLDIQKKHAYAADATNMAIDMICATVVNPSLNSASLQDSYGVNTPKKLLLKMVDNSAEFAALMSFVFEFSGYGNEEELRKQVKNS